MELTAEGTGGVAGLGRKGVALASAGLLLVLFLVSLDQTIVSTAMPRIVAELDGFELYAWVTTSYLVAETVVIPIVGKLGVARDSLSGAITSGFIVALVGIGLALVAAFLMKDLRLDDKTPADSAPGAAEEVAEGAVLPAKAVGPLRETAPRTEG